MVIYPKQIALTYVVYAVFIVYYERFQPTRLFILSRWSMIVQVSLVLNRTISESDWHFNNLSKGFLIFKNKVLEFFFKQLLN